MSAPSTAHADQSASLVIFEADQTRYVHWRLRIDGTLATLSMDVNEERGLKPGYRLKLMLEAADGRLRTRAAPAVNALNERLRDDYIKDTITGVARWNRIMRKHGIDFELEVPHKAFNREIGSLADVNVTPRGEVISAEQWNANLSQWLPTAEDRAFVRSLMRSVTEPGKLAHWIAPPERGIDSRPVDFEYVRFG